MSQSSETPGTPARRLPRTFDEQSKQRALFIALLVVALASIALLILGDKPWEIRIDERLAAGKRIKLDLFIAEGIWLAAAFNLLCATLLFATRGIWSGPLPGIFQNPPAAQRGPGIKWWFASGLGLAMLVSGVERWPKLEQGFGNDEEYAFRRLVHGEHTHASDGRLTFEPRTWSETLFGNSASNNHVFFAALSRLSHDFFETLCGTEPHAVIERAARLPSFVAGLLSIPLLGLLLAQIGMPRAGLIAGWLLAFNPWHLRYATEARGYSVMMFCL